jgi:hypothetical protein
VELLVRFISDPNLLRQGNDRDFSQLSQESTQAQGPNEAST